MNYRYIQDDGVTAERGLAGDEFLMTYHGAKAPASEPTLRLYTYRSHCALVGRFQNIEAEIDLPACREYGISVNRRPTGGGAILMGEHQLGLSFTGPASDFAETKPLEIYKRFSLPVIRALEKLGIHARFRPKNDLEVNGRKIAGLGVYFDPFGAMLFHTSLLVNLDVPLMLRVLKIPYEKISDKPGTSSVEQRITRVSNELKTKITTAEVREIVKQTFEEVFEITLNDRPWSDDELHRMEMLAQEKYLSPNWIFQRTPQPEMSGMSIKKTQAGLIRTYLGLKGEVIKSVLITGDFFQPSETLTRIEAGLKWSALDKNSISKIIADSFAGDRSSNGLSAEDVVESVWKAAQNARAKNRFTNAGSCYYPNDKNFS